MAGSPKKNLQTNIGWIAKAIFSIIPIMPEKIENFNNQWEISYIFSSLLHSFSIYTLMQKYKRNRKETKIDIELLLTNPTKKDHKNKIINPIFQVFLLTFPLFLYK